MSKISYPALPELLRAKRSEWVPIFPGQLDEHFYMTELDGAPCTVAIGVKNEDGKKKLSIIVVHYKAWEEDLVLSGKVEKDSVLAEFSRRHSVRLGLGINFTAEAIAKNPECFTPEACAVVAKAKAKEYCEEKSVDEPFRELVEAFYFDALCEGVQRAKEKKEEK